MLSGKFENSWSYEACPQGLGRSAQRRSNLSGMEVDHQKSHRSMARNTCCLLSIDKARETAFEQLIRCYRLLECVPVLYGK
jgi:hypothetical protein